MLWAGPWLRPQRGVAKPFMSATHKGDGGFRLFGGGAGCELGNGLGEGGNPLGLARNEGVAGQLELAARRRLQDQLVAASGVKPDRRHLRKRDAEDDPAGEERSDQPDQGTEGKIATRPGGDESPIGEEDSAFGKAALSGQQVFDADLPSMRFRFPFIRTDSPASRLNFDGAAGVGWNVATAGGAVIAITLEIKSSGTSDGNPAAHEALFGAFEPPG